MKLESVGACVAFLDDLRERGARGVKLSFLADGTVGGLELAFAPPRAEAPAPRPRPRLDPGQNEQERENARQNARIPAGLGYGSV